MKKTPSTTLKQQNHILKFTHTTDSTLTMNIFHSKAFNNILKLLFSQKKTQNYKINKNNKNFV